AKAGAPVLLVDLVRPADPETVVRLVHEHAQDAPPVLERDFTASLHAAYTVDEVRRQLISAGLGQFKVEQVDDLHLVAWGGEGTSALHRSRRRIGGARSRTGRRLPDDDPGSQCSLCLARHCDSNASVGPETGCLRAA